MIIYSKINIVPYELHIDIFFLKPKGIYECIHIMKKSIPFREYKKKARDFDKVTDNKTIEKVEDLVRYRSTIFHYFIEIVSTLLKFLF